MIVTDEIIIFMSAPKTKLFIWYFLFAVKFLHVNIQHFEGYITDVHKYLREREGSVSGSDDDRDHESVTFVVGGSYDEFPVVSSAPPSSTITTLTSTTSGSTTSVSTLRSSLTYPPLLIHQGNSFER